MVTWLEGALAQLTALVASHAPSGWTRWDFAGAVVAAGFLVGALSGRLLARALQVLVVIAAVLVGWKLVTG